MYCFYFGKDRMVSSIAMVLRLIEFICAETCKIRDCSCVGPPGVAVGDGCLGCSLESFSESSSRTRLATSTTPGRTDLSTIKVHMANVKRPCRGSLALIFSNLCSQDHFSLVANCLEIVNIGGVSVFQTISNRRVKNQITER